MVIVPCSLTTQVMHYSWYYPIYFIVKYSYTFLSQSTYFRYLAVLGVQKKNSIANISLEHQGIILKCMIQNTTRRKCYTDANYHHNYNIMGWWCFCMLCTFSNVLYYKLFPHQYVLRRKKSHLPSGNTRY